MVVYIYFVNYYYNYVNYKHMLIVEQTGFLMLSYSYYTSCEEML